MKAEIFTTSEKVAERALLASEQRFHSLLVATSDYVYTVTVSDRRSVATWHGPGCEIITGFTSNELAADRSLWFKMIYEEDRSAVLAQVARIVNGDAPFPLEHRIIHKSGDLRWIRNVPVPQHDSKGRLLSYNGLISDITERKRSEQLLALQFAVTDQLAEARTVPEALQRSLQTICQALPWDWAAFWAFDASKQNLEWSGLWYSTSREFAEFHQASSSLRFPCNESLPSCTWESGEPTWIADVVEREDFLRATIAGRIGLHGACAIPIRRGKDRVGIIELLSRKIQPREPHIIEMLKAAGAQIGQFLERRWAEEALTSERNLLRTLIDNLPDYVFAKDCQSRFRMNNLAHSRVLGTKTGKDVIGKSDLDFFPTELAERYLKDDQEVFKSGQALFNREELVMNAAGNQQWVLTTKVPWKDNEGRIIGLIGISRDITERKRADEKQRLSEARLQAIVDNSPAVIYVKDLGGRYLLVNGRFETLFHLQRGDAVGQTDSELFPEELAAKFRANDQQVIAHLAAIEFEEVVQAADGAHTYISLKFPLLNPSGESDGICGISTDISERKRGEDELQSAYIELAQNDETLKKTVQELQVAHEELKTTHAELRGTHEELKAAHDELKAAERQLIQAAKLECIGTLAAGVAHEVKNPLQTILMGLHYVSKNLSGNNEGITLALQDMHEAVTRANTIVCGLLELSAETQAEKQIEDLHACIEHSLWLLRHEFMAAQTSVVRQLTVDLPLLLLDRGKMEQVFINVLINALHAMPHGGTITITTRVEHWNENLALRKPIFRPFRLGDTLVIVELQDTGSGIPESSVPKIFDAFFTTKSGGHGTGLGLTVVKKIMALHGGGIEVQNAPAGGVLVTLVMKAEAKDYG